VAENRDSFVPLIAGTAAIGAAAIGLSALFKIPLTPQFTFSVDDMLIGVIATLPMVIFLWWFSNTKIPSVAQFRDSQIEFFARLDFEFTPSRIILMAFGAGVSEELLFRGVFQTGLDRFLPVMAAIFLSNIIFGLLHMRTVLYAIIAGCVGLYLGVIYALNGNLMAPIVTHMLYDAIAFEYTRRAIAGRQVR